MLSFKIFGCVVGLDLRLTVFFNLAYWSLVYDSNIVSDLHKDAFGFRPSLDWWEAWNNGTEEYRQEEWDYLLRALEAELDREKRRERQAIQEFEGRIVTMLEHGAADREVAKRWVIDSLRPSDIDLAYGGEWVCWSLGLPFSMEVEFNGICEEMLKDLLSEDDGP